MQQPSQTSWQIFKQLANQNTIHTSRLKDEVQPLVSVVKNVPIGQASSAKKAAEPEAEEPPHPKISPFASLVKERYSRASHRSGTAPFSALHSQPNSARYDHVAPMAPPSFPSPFCPPPVSHQHFSTIPETPAPKPTEPATQFYIPEENHDMDVLRTKYRLLTEGHDCEQQGYAFARPLNIYMSFDDLHFEIQQANEFLDRKLRLSKWKNMIPLAYTALDTASEFSKHLPIQIHLKGISGHMKKLMEQDPKSYDRVIEKLYNKMNKKTPSSPVMDAFLLFVVPVVAYELSHRAQKIPGLIGVVAPGLVQQLAGALRPSLPSKPPSQSMVTLPHSSPTTSPPVGPPVGPASVGPAAVGPAVPKDAPMTSSFVPPATAPVVLPTVPSAPMVPLVEPAMTPLPTKRPRLVFEPAP